MKKPFKLRRLGRRKGPDRPGDSWATVITAVDERGRPTDEVIIAINTGPNRSDAERFVGLLNGAWEDYIEGRQA